MNNKNTILVVNPTKLNVMKAICNAIVANILDIIILGNRLVIESLCKELRFNINLLQIIDCEYEEDIYFKLNQYKDISNIIGIIYDDLDDFKIKTILNYKPVCHMVNFGEFNKSIFLLNNYNENDSLDEVMDMLSRFNIFYISIGLVYVDKEKANQKKQNIKAKYSIRKINIIDTNKIKKCNNNVIIFENKILKSAYLSSINSVTLTRIIEIRETNNEYIFNIKGLKLKNIFFIFLFLSKVSKKYLNSQTKII